MRTTSEKRHREDDRVWMSFAADAELLERLEKDNNAKAWDAYRRGVDATHELEMAELDQKLAAEGGLPPPPRNRRRKAQEKLDQATRDLNRELSGEVGQ